MSIPAELGCLEGYYPGTSRGVFEPLTEAAAIYDDWVWTMPIAKSF